MAIHIPSAHHQQARELLGLPVDSRAKLLEALSRAEPCLSRQELVNALASDGGLPKRQVDAVVTVVVSLFLTLERSEGSKSELAGDAATALFELADDREQVAFEDLAELSDFLRELLAFDQPIGITAKANEVLTSHQRPLLSSRIFSDVRPVFSSDDSPEPIAAVAVHTLRLRVLPRSGEEEIFVALDSADLRQLQRTVDRAIEKDRQIQALVEAMDLPCLYISED